MSDIHPTICLHVREVTGNLPDFPDDQYGSPDAYKQGRWFYVEVHGRNVIGWWGPLALGVVAVREDGRASLESLIVVDPARGNGFGEMIVEASGERWPRLHWHGCSASREFHARLVEKGIAKPHEYLNGAFDFVSKSERQH